MGCHRLYLVLLLGLVANTPNFGQVRVDLDAQWRLGEGLMAQGTRGPIGRYVSVAESYFILDPVITIGLAFGTDSLRWGVGVKGVFPHPLAGPTRLWPLAWAEASWGVLGVRSELGWGGIGLSQDIPAWWYESLVPGVGLFAQAPPLRWALPELSFAPRVSLGVRGSVLPRLPFVVNPYSLSLGVGMVTEY